MGRWAWIAGVTLLSVVFVGAIAGSGPAAGDPGPAAVQTGDLTRSLAPADAVRSAPVAPASPALTAPQAPTASTRTVQEGPDLQLPAQQEFERTRFRILVDADGDAVWTFRYEQPIDTDEDRESFRSYAERFRTEETTLHSQFLDQAVALTDAAAAETGREMNATAFERDAGIEQTATGEVGYVELSFRWTNFARVDDGQLHVGDVFRGGLFLDDGQSLVYEAGDGVHFVSVAPADAASTSQDELVESATVTWTGEENFADRHPRAVLEIEDGGVAGAGTDSGSSMMWMVGGGALVVVLTLAAALVRRRDIPGLPRGDSSTDVSTGGAGTMPETAPEPPEVPSTLQDDERVLQLLDESDGRMKQSDIVEQTEWSKSKVSMLLSEMEEEDQISKIQVGRENIIALEGHEPEAAGSPFDDE